MKELLKKSQFTQLHEITMYNNKTIKILIEK